MKLFNYFRVRSIGLALVSSFVLCGTLGNDAWATDPLVLHFDNTVDSHLADSNNFDGYVSRRTIWPRTGDTYDIPVCWENYPDQLTGDKENVRRAIADTWEKESFVRFTGWGQCPASSRGIRITIDLDLGTTPHTKGLGKQIDSVEKGMLLNLLPATTLGNRQVCGSDDRICSAWTAIHEFGHALGFDHEQNRSDRIIASFGQRGCDPNDYLNKPVDTNNGDITIGIWDLASILNYCNPQWNNAGKLSEIDIATVKYFYDEVPRYQTFSKTVTIPVARLDDQKYEIRLRELENTSIFLIDSVAPTSRSSKTEASIDPVTGHLTVPLVLIEDAPNPAQVFVYKNVTLAYDLNTNIVTVVSYGVP